MSIWRKHEHMCGLRTATLKAEINEDAWSTLNSDTSRPFAKPLSGLHF